MKYISFIIPCFNSSEYMEHCIKSCMIDDDVEILIIDDGSKKDNTLEIAKKYEELYPNVCKAIHKENGGHGSVVNLGIKEATGLYLKVVDSDDWIDSNVGKEILSHIKSFTSNNMPDLIITDFMYDKVNAINKKVMSYTDAIKQEVILNWDQVGKFSNVDYLLMHSLMYKRSVLLDCNLKLPEHTFYVDNIYAYKPLPYVKSLIYYHKTLYHYFIGRNDQSVNEKVMIGRLEQQYRVTYCMLNEVDLWSIEHKRLEDYMINYMNIIMTVTSILSIRSKDEKWIEERNKLWDYVKSKDIKLYYRLKNTIQGRFVSSKSRLVMKISEIIYILCRGIFGFN